MRAGLAGMALAMAAAKGALVAVKEETAAQALAGETAKEAPTKRRLTPAEVDLVLKERRRRIQAARDAGDWREVRKLQGNPVTAIEESRIAAACQRRDRKAGRRLVAAAKGGIGKHEVRS